MPEAKVKWIGEKQFVAESGSGHALVLDAGPEVGGHNTGPSPMELVLQALGGCTAFDVVFILKDKMHKPLTGLTVQVSAQRTDVSPKVYTEIDMLYRLRGAGLQEKDAVRAIKLSAEKYCSVSAMLEKTATIRSRYELLDEASGQTVSGTVERE